MNKHALEKILFIASILIFLAGCAPSVTIESPEDGAAFDGGKQITFSGFATDFEDGDLTGESLVWESDIDGQIGTGDTFTTDGLRAGEHTITLTATDSDGEKETDEITITVKEAGGDGGNGDNATEGPLPLSEIKLWGYQIQQVAEGDAIDKSAESHYDMLVLEPTRTDWSDDTNYHEYFDTKAMVDRLKKTYASDGKHRKLIIAYIDIGEAEDWRWYWTWSEDWDPGAPMPADWPDFIITRDPDGWTGNYPVAYWDEGWKDIVIYGENQDSSPYGYYNSIIDEVIKDGFDGIYLDWVEAFENEQVMQAAGDAGLDPAGEMIKFIGEMREYAGKRNPDFIIIQQNAASLAGGRSDLFSVIDAIAQEAIWYDGDATDDWEDRNGHDFINDDDLIEYYIDYLDLYLKADVPVFACEYALRYADDAYEKAYEMGYIPYVTRRSLGELTSTPPPGY